MMATSFFSPRLYTDLDCRIPACLLTADPLAVVVGTATLLHLEPEEKAPALISWFQG